MSRTGAWVGGGFVVVAAGALLLAFFFVDGCRDTPPPDQNPRSGSCIEVPTSVAESEKDAAVRLGATLEELPASADLETEFQNTVRQEFQVLSEKNASLYLFLSAIHCYLKEGKVGEVLAERMADFVMNWWRAEVGISGGTSELAPIEKRHIDQSPDRDRIYVLLRQFNIE